MSFLKEVYAKPENEYAEIDRNQKSKKHPKPNFIQNDKNSDSISSLDFWSAYPNYDDYESFEVWDKIGGSVGRRYREENSCAARISYALNNSGHPIQPINEIKRKRFFKNDDNLYYLISAYYLKKYMKFLYGKPISKIIESNEDVKTLKNQLKGKQCCILIGVYPEGYGHCAVLKNDYQDVHTPYAKMNAWILSKN